MKQYFKKWRLILEQKLAGDYRFVATKGPREIKIHIIDKETGEAPEGKPNQYGEPSGLAHMSLKKRDGNPFWEVASVSSPLNSTGVGKELYLLALELASASGLSPDSVNISPMAINIWNNYLKSHPQVETKEKETEVDASEDDPYKYVFYIDPRFESELDVEYKRMEHSDDKGAGPEREPEPFDPDIDLDDYLEDVYEAREPPKKDDDTDRVSKVVIYDKKGNILLLKRTGGKKNWDLPGGHLKKGENHEKGARREAKEETNLVISDLKHVKDHGKVVFYKCPAPNGDIQLQAEEHTDFEWVNPADVGDYPLRNSIKTAILDAISVVQEDFQQNVKKNYSKLKFKMIGQGKNKYNVGGKLKKPSYERSKSSPGGFGGS